MMVIIVDIEVTSATNQIAQWSMISHVVMGHAKYIITLMYKLHHKLIISYKIYNN